MIDTAIGLETGTDRKLGHARLQEHFARVGLQPYLPQLGATRLKKIGQTSVEVFALSSYNLATQYNPETEELDWPQEAIEACRLFPHPMIGYYGKYHYAQHPTEDPAGASQAERLTVFLRWLRATVRSTVHEAEIRQAEQSARRGVSAPDLGGDD